MQVPESESLPAGSGPYCFTEPGASIGQRGTGHREVAPCKSCCTEPRTVLTTREGRNGTQIVNGTVVPRYDNFTTCSYPVGKKW